MPSFVSTFCQLSGCIKAPYWFEFCLTERIQDIGRQQIALGQAIDSKQMVQAHLPTSRAEYTVDPQTWSISLTIEVGREFVQAGCEQ